MGFAREREARDRKLAEIVATDKWIIEGVYHQWVGQSLDRADLILALTPSVWLRDARLIRRFHQAKTWLSSFEDGVAP